MAFRKSDGKVKLSQIHDLTAAGAISVGFRCTLIGVLFLSLLAVLTR